jgi:hypothetical protein
MKYMLMMHHQGQGPYAMARWPEKDIKAHIGFMRDFSKKLADAGELAAAEGLAAPSEAKHVRAGKNGEPVTDGVFPETKEFLVGYWIVDVESTERAYEIAAGASVAPGPGGVPLGIVIEVRQVMHVPAKDFV